MAGSWKSGPGGPEFGCMLLISHLMKKSQILKTLARFRNLNVETQSSFGKLCTCNWTGMWKAWAIPARSLKSGPRGPSAFGNALHNKSRKERVPLRDLARSWKSGPGSQGSWRHDFPKEPSIEIIDFRTPGQILKSGPHGALRHAFA